jgi:D-alanyl-D-alanine carboxypeptidase
MTVSKKTTDEEAGLTTFLALKKAIFRVCIPVLLICALLASAGPAEARKKKNTGENNKYAAFVMDAHTGQVFFERHADKPLHPASLTKVMTLLMLFEAIESGKVSLRDRIPISQHAASMPASKLGLKAGSSIRVEDAIYALVTLSANDISAAIGEYLGGTERGFARMMTARAKTIGMNKTRFMNASGLNHPQQISSARDMATLARFVITTYPNYYRYFSRTNFTYNGRNYHNHNRLMGKYDGMDGMKTGFINASGFNLVASAVRGDRRLIGVVFGGRTAQSRNNHMAEILDAAFKRARSLPKDPVLMASASGAQPPILKQKNIAAETAPVQTAQVLRMDERGAGPAISAPNVIITSADAPVANIPTPGRKPGLLVAAGQINRYISPSSSAAPSYGSSFNAAPADPVPVLTALAPETTSEITSEPASLSRIEPAAASAPSSFMAGDLPAWAIQVGAFSSRAATDKALHDSMRKLPVKFASLNPIIAPLKTPDGWIFRARLHGLSKDEAQSACRYLRECVAVAPQHH